MDLGEPMRQIVLWREGGLELDVAVNLSARLLQDLSLPDPLREIVRGARVESTIIVSVVGLAHNLGLETCAEGVETPAVWGELRSLGCDVAQGYLVSRPIPAAEIPGWAERWTKQRPQPR